MILWPKTANADPKNVTSADVHDWAVDQQVIDLEDGEIIDDEVICIDTQGPVKVTLYLYIRLYLI